MGSGPGSILTGAAGRVIGDYVLGDTGFPAA
jgi:hypothetical protein